MRYETALNGRAVALVTFNPRHFTGAAEKIGMTWSHHLMHL